MQNINTALLHLKKDKLLAKIIEKFPKPNLNTDKDYFEALLESIIYQQLSGKSAGTIERRFKALFKGKPTPLRVLKLKDIQFREAGISGQKMNYLKDLSIKFLNGTINSSNFNTMTDEDIRLHLISVRGIGRWTADMFLIFTLNRLDVLPTGDLGIKKGFKKVFNLRKLPDDKKMQKLANSWRPYSTVASLYLWKVANDIK